VSRGGYTSPSERWAEVESQALCYRSYILGINSPKPFLMATLMHHSTNPINWQFSETKDNIAKIMFQVYLEARSSSVDIDGRNHPTIRI